MSRVDNEDGDGDGGGGGDGDGGEVMRPWVYTMPAGRVTAKLLAQAMIPEYTLELHLVSDKSESESESERDDADGGGGLRGVPLYTHILADMRFIGMCTFQAQYVPKEKRGAAHISHNTNNASLVEQSGE